MPRHLASELIELVFSSNSALISVSGNGCGWASQNQMIVAERKLHVGPLEMLDGGDDVQQSELLDPW